MYICTYIYYVYIYIYIYICIEREIHMYNYVRDQHVVLVDVTSGGLQGVCMYTCVYMCIYIYIYIVCITQGSYQSE